MMLPGRRPALSVATSLPARCTKVAPAPTACFPSTLSALVASNTAASRGAPATTSAVHASAASTNQVRPVPHRAPTSLLLIELPSELADGIERFERRVVGRDARRGYG